MIIILIKYFLNAETIFLICWCQTRERTMKRLRFQGDSEGSALTLRLLIGPFAAVLTT